MKSLVARLAAVWIAGMAWPGWAAPLEAYTQPPAIHAATLSPSGRQIALMIHLDGETSLVVQDATSKALIARASFGKIPTTSARWVGERGLLVTTQVDHDPAAAKGGAMSWRRVHFFDVAASRLTPLHSNAESGMNNIVGAPMIRVVDGEPAVFLEAFEFIDQRGSVALFRADLDTGKTSPVAHAEQGVRRWIVDASGKPAAQEVFVDRTRQTSIKVKTVEGWRTAYSSAPTESVRLVSLSADGRGVVYSVRRPNGLDEWREARLDGSLDKPPVVAADGQVPLTDPQTGQLIGHYVMDGDAERYSYLDKAYEQVIAEVTSAFEAVTVEVKSWSADRRAVIAWVDRPRESPGYALVDVAARKASWIASMYPGLSTADVGLKTRVRFKATDGLELVGYLTRPPGSEHRKNLPLIVLPHDGPWGRDTVDFDWWAQAMASRGYAVLQLNYRGSDGFGDALREAGRGQWGRKMQTDLSDGVGALASGGLIDPKRVCIVGEGYGGYAALAGATINPGVYRCAVSVDGVSDLAKQIAYAKTSVGGRPLTLLNYYIGREVVDDPSQLAALSPVRRAEQADVPILLLHNSKDREVASSQSQAMADALRRAGKEVELVLLPGDGDWQDRADARHYVVAATMAFLEKHNPPN
ncbi:MAG: S9 family peptidase [Phenylobacterium sp.]|uniref:alpha/beta hydrolase family protein n=1 Tax=Phenylobacterium sp. TaxID=1871053 RepID=UPI001214A7C4|nr:prolyl oligopeptidase family serine peptidase [Phenylobacterium sp.]TAL36033.1 MAG: S9 family peptidase [Phenylobacterium sp.]